MSYRIGECSLAEYRGLQQHGIPLRTTENTVLLREAQVDEVLHRVIRGIASLAVYSFAACTEHFVLL